MSGSDEGQDMDRKLFVFDVGGVVICYTPILQNLCIKYSLDPAKIREDWAAYSKPLMDGYIGTDVMYRMMENKYGIDLSNDDFMISCYHPEINQPVREAVLALRAAGHRVVTGSNTYAGHWDYCKAMNPSPLDVFDKLYASHEMHFSKPDPEFFEFILKEEGFRAEDSVFIDDSARNLETASALGMKTFNYLQNDDEFGSFLAPYLC